MARGSRASLRLHRLAWLLEHFTRYSQVLAGGGAGVVPGIGGGVLAGEEGFTMYRGDSVARGRATQL